MLLYGKRQVMSVKSGKINMYTVYFLILEIVTQAYRKY